MLKANIRVLAFACVAVFLAGCGHYVSFNGVTGSRTTATQQFELADFSKVEAHSTFEVLIVQGDKYEVAITADDNVMEHLDVSRAEDTLRIGLKPNTSLRNATLKAEVTMPQLRAVSLAGATRATISDFASEGPIQIRVCGASSVQGQIKSSDAQVEVEGASRAKLRGSTGKLRVKASGASNVNLADYSAEDAAVNASGATHVTVNAVGVLDVHADGASSVRHVGTPAKLTAKTSGASSVKRSNLR